MDEALIQRAKDNINRDQRCEDQEGLGLERILKGLGVALKGGDQGGRDVQVQLCLLDRLDSLPEGSADRIVIGWM